MAKCRNATKVGGGIQKDTSPTLSYHGDKPCDTAHDLMEETASMEEVLLQMGASPRIFFRFTHSSRSPSIHSLSLEHQWACSTLFCNMLVISYPLYTWEGGGCSPLHIRVTLGEGGDQSPPSHTWRGLLIANILQEACSGDHITEAVILALKEAILFFGRCSHKEALLYRDAKDVELDLRGPVNWAGKTAQVEVTVNNM